MSGDKMVDRAAGLDPLSLGVEFLNCNLKMIVDNYKAKRLLELLNIEWSSDRKKFTVLAAAVLIGISTQLHSRVRGCVGHYTS